MSNGESLLQFQPINQKRVSHEAVRQILAQIESGQLEPGQRLPSERELTRQFAISRNGVREAIRLLEAQGVLEVHPGLGTFVASRADIDRLSARWRNWLIEHQSQVLDLLEVRGVLEPLAARRAAEKATPEDVRTMVEIVERIDHHLSNGNVEDAVDGDISFHHFVSQCSGNAFLIELNEGINVALIENRLAYYSIPGKGNLSNQEHRRVVEAIRAGDSDMAAQAMYEHIRDALIRTRSVFSDLSASRKEGTGS